MDTAIRILLILLTVLVTALMLLKRRAKHFRRSTDWQKHERDGGGS